ncbi:MAG TPA: YceI family protein [Nevskiaceae bacterium]|nr:YceI family protein [Nevskiaceae bacterium]
MKRIFLLCVAAALSFTVNAAPPSRAILAKDSTIGFVFKQENVPVSGSFGKFSGTLALDPANPQAIRISIDTGSIHAGSDDADTEVVKPGWLSVAAFPQATFASKSVSNTGGANWQSTGMLTIKGIARDVTVPFTVKEHADGSAELDGQFQIKRADYKVGEGEWSAFDTIANEIQVKFHLVLGAAPH